MIRHGVSGYTGGCRCEVCRAAWADYHRGYRQRRARNDDAPLRRSRIPDAPNAGVQDEKPARVPVAPSGHDVIEGPPLPLKRFPFFRRRDLVGYLLVVSAFTLLAWLFVRGWWLAAVALIGGALVFLTEELIRRRPPRVRSDKRERPFRYEAGVRLSLPRTEWERLKAESNGRCFYCLVETEQFEAEHVIPVSRGGSSMTWNFVAACERCNRLKGTRTGWEFVSVPTAEQRQRFEDIDRLTQRRTVPWIERRRLRRQALARRRVGAKKRSEIAGQKRKAELEEERRQRKQKQRESDVRVVKATFKRLNELVERVEDEANQRTQNPSTGWGPRDEIEWNVEWLLTHHKYWLPNCRRLIEATDSEIQEAASEARDEIQRELQWVETENRLKYD